MISVGVLQHMLPIVLSPATNWAGRTGEEIIRRGRSLNDTQLALARRIGVARPEQVRYQVVETLPRPSAELDMLARHGHVLTPATESVMLGYGICVRRDVDNIEYWLAHELVHVMQFERMGSLREFIRQYVANCLEYGHDESPFEIEARTITEYLLQAGEIPQTACEAAIEA